MKIQAVAIAIAVSATVLAIGDTFPLGGFGRSNPSVGSPFFSKASASGTWLRGRCHSKITGTDLGFVYGDSEAKLVANCGRIAIDPIVDNVQAVTKPESGMIPSDIYCSGDLPPPPSGDANNDPLAGPITTVEGLLTGQACVTGYGRHKKAKKLYCTMYDPAHSPDTSACNNDVSTNNTCLNTAFVEMTMVHGPSDAKDDWGYCWRFNSEDVGHRRDFRLQADF